MHLISGRTLSKTMLNAFDKLLDNGFYQPSRNGGCTALYDVTLEVQNPRSRHLHLQGRTNNIFQMIAETFWVMAGEDKLDPYLSFFLPRARDYSDDGLTWHGAYGPRLYAYDQMEGVVKTFKEDGVFTRRAYATIQMPQLDSPQAIEEWYGVGYKANDIPCNQQINFYIENGNQFCAKTIQRSGDSIFGAGSINPFEFSFLQELMYNEIVRIHPDAGIKLGAYRWHVTNFHLYDFTKSQAEAVTDEYWLNNEMDSKYENHMALIGPWVGYWKDFFGQLLEVYSEAITDETGKMAENAISHLGASFVAYGVPVENNLLWIYALLIADYIAAKKGVVAVPHPTDISHCDIEFKQAIVNSGFRKFEVKYEIE